MDVAVDIPPDDSAAAVAGAPDDAVDVAIVPPDAYALLLDVAVAQLFALAHAGADVLVSVSSSVAGITQLVLSYVCHPIVAGVISYDTTASAGSR